MLLSAELQLLLVKHKLHLLVKLILIVLYLVNHLVELFFALIKQEFLEIHLFVLLVGILPRQLHAELHVQLQVRVLRRRLHEDYLCQLIEKRRRELVLAQDLLGDAVVVVRAQFVQQGAQILHYQIESVDLCWS